NLKFGYRGAEHKRETHFINQGPNFAADPFNNLPKWNGETYPGDFASGIGGNFPRNPWMLSPGELERWSDIYASRDPVTRHDWTQEFALKEKVNAFYLMTNFEGAGWGGNVGVRFAKTREEVTVNVAVPTAVCPPLQPCPSVPGAITSSAFGTY